MTPISRVYGRYIYIYYGLETLVMGIPKMVGL